MTPLGFYYTYFGVRTSSHVLLTMLDLGQKNGFIQIFVMRKISYYYYHHDK